MSFARAVSARWAPSCRTSDSTASAIAVPCPSSSSPSHPSLGPLPVLALSSAAAFDGSSVALSWFLVRLTCHRRAPHLRRFRGLFFFRSHLPIFLSWPLSLFLARPRHHRAPHLRRRPPNSQGGRLPFVGHRRPVPSWCRDGCVAGTAAREMDSSCLASGTVPEPASPPGLRGRRGTGGRWGRAERQEQRPPPRKRAHIEGGRQPARARAPPSLPGRADAASAPGAPPPTRNHGGARTKGGSSALPRRPWGTGKVPQWRGRGISRVSSWGPAGAA